MKTEKPYRTLYRMRAIEPPPAEPTRPLVPLRPTPTGWFETPATGAPSVRIAAPARFFGPRKRAGAETPARDVSATQSAPTVHPAVPAQVAATDWPQRDRDIWVAAAMLDWPTSLEAAIDTSPPRFPAWDPDCCGHPVAASGFHELTLPCTLERGHARSGHEVRDTTGELMAETVKPAPRRKPSPRPHAKPVREAS